MMALRPRGVAISVFVTVEMSFKATVILFDQCITMKLKVFPQPLIWV